MKRLIRKTFVAILLTGGATMAFAQQQMPPIPVDSNVRIGKLDNGLITSVTMLCRKNRLTSILPKR